MRLSASLNSSQRPGQHERRRQGLAADGSGRESKVMRSLFWPLPQGLLICVVVTCSGIQRPALFVYVGTLRACERARASVRKMSLEISGVKVIR